MFKSVEIGFSASHPRSLSFLILIPVSIIVEDNAPKAWQIVFVILLTKNHQS